MFRMLRRGRFAVALLAVLAANTESSAQTVVVPGIEPPRSTPGMRARSLGREFMDKLRYPFYAIPESFAPDPTPPRTVLRPSYDGTLVPVPVRPEPVKRLYISGYAGGRPPAPRAPLVPTTRGGLLAPLHGSHGSHGHRVGH